MRSPSSRCPDSPSVARCSCTIIRPGIWSRAALILMSQCACTTAALVSVSSTTTRRAFTSSSRFLAEALSDQRVRFALLKGWRNYLCLARLEQATGGAAQLFDDGQAGEVGMISQWSRKTHDGSLADLPTPPRPEVWDEVSAEPDVC